MQFIEEYKQLQSACPRISLLSVNSENSPYTNYCSFNKNCHLCCGVHYSEDCYYLTYSVKNTDCVDCEDIENSELLYESILCEKCYNCSFGAYLMSCSDCDFCWDLVNCRDCFLCTAVQNKQYYILNEKYSREEYFERKETMMRQFGISGCMQKLEEFKMRVPQRFAFQKNCENCIGPDLRNCKNMFYAFAAKNSEDCAYTLRHINNVKDGYDIACCAADPSEELYNSIGLSGDRNVMCSHVIWFSNDIFYCEQIWNSNYLLGCIGRNHAEYEILNKKYPKEEWHKKFAEIKNDLRKENHWGKIWMPSTYPYKDTLAALYYSE